MVFLSPAETAECTAIRTEVFRFPFYVVSGGGSSVGEKGARRRFLEYQFARHVDAEDFRAMVWVTDEPSDIELKHLRFGTNRTKRDGNHADEISRLQLSGETGDGAVGNDGRVADVNNGEGLLPGMVMTVAEASCTFKHLTALRDIVQRNVSHAVVLEDNVAFRGSVSDALRIYQAEAESGKGECEGPLPAEPDVGEGRGARPRRRSIGCGGDGRGRGGGRGGGDGGDGDGGWDMVFDSDLWNLAPEGPLEPGRILYPKDPTRTSFPCPAQPELACESHGASKGANFYVVTRRAAAALVGAFFTSDQVIDHRFNDLIRSTGLDVRWAQPPNVIKVDCSSS
jgi:hypothetical protein